MSDKETAPWMLDAAVNHLKKVNFSAYQLADEPKSEWQYHLYPDDLIEIMTTFAVECRAPAPQPANYAIALDVVDAIEWIDQNEPKRARDALAEVRDKLRATPQVAPTLKEILKQYGAHHIRDCDALNKWKELPCDCGFAALIEGTSEQASPREFKPYMEDHEYYDQPQAPPTPEEKTAKLAELKQAYDCGNLGWSEAMQLYWTWHSSAATPKGTR